MDSFKFRFIIGKLTNEELEVLKNGGPIITKMLLMPEDYKVFHYKEGNEIEVETQDGNRIWTTITNMEIVEDEERVIIIFTLMNLPGSKSKCN
jgi:hypothetical protein